MPPVTQALLFANVAVYLLGGPGVLSLDEFQASVEERFQAIDANQDKSIDLSELKSGVPVRVPTP